MSKSLFNKKNKYQVVTNERIKRKKSVYAFQKWAEKTEFAVLPIIILTRGMVPRETLAALELVGIEVH